MCECRYLCVCVRCMRTSLFFVVSFRYIGGLAPFEAAQVKTKETDEDGGRGGKGGRGRGVEYVNACMHMHVKE